MAQVVLYIAVSLDGYIAREDGSIDWLDIVDSPDEDYGYQPFYDSIEVCLMGRRTYDQIKGFGGWPYAEKLSCVFTSRRPSEDSEDIRFVSGSPQIVIQQLIEEEYESFWLVGGGKLNAAFLDADLVDEIVLSTIPVALGRGVGLFSDARPNEAAFEVAESRTYPTGVVQVRYCKK
jgi:dihydrofolate reductase